jgi:GNAT superfamily N-acetyltransferase
MNISVIKTDLMEIIALRNLFLSENNFQIRYNAYHARGWSDSYMVMYDEVKIGYGSIKGNENTTDRDTVFEFYIIPSFRSMALDVFSKLLHVSKAAFIECQSNDVLLTSLVYQRARNINAHVVLFEDHTTSCFAMDTVFFRRRNENDSIFEHQSEPVGDYVIELNNEIVATGGFLLHYNMPFADLYMEVKEMYRERGIGSFLIQELKRQCYLSGRVPAARCNIDNTASRATLTKAGMRTAGFMLLGQTGSGYPGTSSGEVLDT